MFRFQNFKGFEDTTLDCERPITLLIGPNGAGKSNAVEALQLFAFLVGGGALHDIGDVGQSAKFNLRGGLEGCVRSGQNTITLSFADPAYEFERTSAGLEYSFTIAINGGAWLQSEVLALGGSPLFTASPSGSGVTEVTLRGGEKRQVATARLALAQLDRFPENWNDFLSFVEVSQSLRRRMGPLWWVDPQPSRMRDYQRIGNSVLQPDGANLSAVLHRLQTTNRPAVDQIIRRIRQLPQEPFASLGFVLTPLNDVMLGLHRPDGGGLISARSLSDGTLRALALLTALEVCDDGARLVIEEFDNGIHPSRIRGLIDAMVERAKARKLRLLVTTHNPATMDALPRECLEGVVLTDWSPSSGSRLVPLPELEGVDELLASGRLGDLVTRRAVERYLEPRSEEDGARAASAWLEALP
jgi:predicted ATPase